MEHKVEIQVIAKTKISKHGHNGQESWSMRKRSNVPGVIETQQSDIDIEGPLIGYQPRLYGELQVSLIHSKMGRERAQE